MPLGTRVWIAAGVTDLRKGMDGLAALVETALGERPTVETCACLLRCSYLPAYADHGATTLTVSKNKVLSVPIGFTPRSVIVYGPADGIWNTSEV